MTLLVGGWMLWPRTEEINLSDSEIHVLRDEDLPPCTRCKEPVQFAVRLPVGGGGGADLELCGACDRDDPVAGRLLRILEDPASGGSMEEMTAATVAWMRAAMLARGWPQIPHQRASVN